MKRSKDLLNQHQRTERISPALYIDILKDCIAWCEDEKDGLDAEYRAVTVAKLAGRDALRLKNRIKDEISEIMAKREGYLTALLLFDGRVNPFLPDVCLTEETESTEEELDPL